MTAAFCSSAGVLLCAGQVRAQVQSKSQQAAQAKARVDTLKADADATQRVLRAAEADAAVHKQTRAELDMVRQASKALSHDSLGLKETIAVQTASLGQLERQLMSSRVGRPSRSVAMQTPRPGELPSAEVIETVQDILNLSGADIDSILLSYDGSR